MSKTVEILGEQAGYYLSHVCRTIDKKSLYLPGPDTVDRIWAESDRSVRTLGSLQWILSNGRLGGTGYVSILPVDQGIEHSAGASFAPNPAYFDPENIVRLAVEGGCNAVASTFRRAGAGAQIRAQNSPSSKSTTTSCCPTPNTYDQVLFGTVRDAWNMGAAAVGATIYFRFAGEPPATGRDRPRVRPGARTGHGDDPVVLPAQRGFQEGGYRLPRFGRSHGGRPTTSV